MEICMQKSALERNSNKLHSFNRKHPALNRPRREEAIDTLTVWIGSAATLRYRAERLSVWNRYSHNIILGYLIAHEQKIQWACIMYLVGTVNRRGYMYLSQQKGTNCDACGPYPSIWCTMKPIFRRIRLIRCVYESLRCLHHEIWRFLCSRQQQWQQWHDRLLYPLCMRAGVIIANILLKRICSWSQTRTHSRSHACLTYLHACSYQLLSIMSLLRFFEPTINLPTPSQAQLVWYSINIAHPTCSLTSHTFVAKVEGVAFSFSNNL